MHRFKYLQSSSRLLISIASFLQNICFSNEWLNCDRQLLQSCSNFMSVRAPKLLFLMSIGSMVLEIHLRNFVKFVLIHVTFVKVHRIQFFLQNVSKYSRTINFGVGHISCFGNTYVYVFCTFCRFIFSKFWMSYFQNRLLAKSDPLFSFKTRKLSEVTVNNELKLGICFKKGHNNIFSKAGLTRQSFTDSLYN
jgi:hypothetical protein